jgi:hypothetical protein
MKSSICFSIKIYILIERSSDGIKKQISGTISIVTDIDRVENNILYN